MAEIVWSEPALSDLDAIADYIALENPAAASELVKRIVEHVGRLADHPESSNSLATARSLSRSAASFIAMTATKFLCCTSCVLSDYFAKGGLQLVRSGQRSNNSFKPKPLRGSGYLRR